MTDVVFIYGPSGSGKSLIAHQIRRIASDREKTVRISDHEIFEDRASFTQQMRAAVDSVSVAGCDLGVICITSSCDFRIEFNSPRLPWWVMEAMLNQKSC